MEVGWQSKIVIALERGCFFLSLETEEWETGWYTTQDRLSGELDYNHPFQPLLPRQFLSESVKYLLQVLKIFCTIKSSLKLTQIFHIWPFKFDRTFEFLNISRFKASKCEYFSGLQTFQLETSNLEYFSCSEDFPVGCIFFHWSHPILDVF